MRETAAPVKNAIYKAEIIFGKPRINPIKKESLTSPKPMPSPFVRRKIRRKKKKAQRAERT